MYTLVVSQSQNEELCHWHLGTRIHHHIHFTKGQCSPICNSLQDGAEQAICLPLKSDEKSSKKLRDGIFLANGSALNLLELRFAFLRFYR